MSYWHTSFGVGVDRGVTCGVVVFDGDHHFPAGMSPDKIGGLAVRLMLCELAATGAHPTGFFVSVIMPWGVDEASDSWLMALRRGLDDGAGLYSCPCFGLTVTRSGSSVTLVMTAVGDRFLGDQKPPILQSGHRLYVAGYLGDRYVGRGVLRGECDGIDPSDQDYFRNAYENPVLSFSLVSALKHSVHAPYLIRTGLRSCLVDMCQSSSLTFYLKETSIPLSDPFQRAMSRLGPDILRRILREGQDYTLLLVAPPGEASNIHYIARRIQIPLTMVGHLAQDTQDG